MLCSACHRWGFGTVWLDPRHPPRIEGPAAILWEGNSAGLHDLHTIREFYPQTPILALIDFPRWEDTQQVALLGSAAVLSKPLNLDDLFSRLTDLLHKSKDAQNHWTRSIA
jgi:DNA-binding response OmpR family regulator